MANESTTREQKPPRVAAVSSVPPAAKRTSADNMVNLRAAHVALSSAARAELDAPYRLGAVLDLMRRFRRDVSASSPPRRIGTRNA